MRSGAKQEMWAGTSEEAELEEYAVYDKNSSDRTAEVGTKRANGFQLHDLSGNVREWVEDCWYNDYELASRDGAVWLVADGDRCVRRVVRGGSWTDAPGSLRASYRDWTHDGNRFNSIGFRLVQDIP